MGVEPGGGGGSGRRPHLLWALIHQRHLGLRLVADELVVCSQLLLCWGSWKMLKDVLLDSRIFYVQKVLESNFLSEYIKNSFQTWKMEEPLKSVCFS